MFWSLKITGYRNQSYTSANWGQVRKKDKQNYQMFWLVMPNIFQALLTCVLWGQVVVVGHMLSGSWSRLWDTRLSPVDKLCSSCSPWDSPATAVPLMNSTRPSKLNLCAGWQLDSPRGLDLQLQQTGKIYFIMVIQISWIWLTIRIDLKR